MDRLIEHGTIKVGPIIGDRELTAGPSFEVFDPGRLGDLVGVVTTASADDVDTAVAAARAAQSDWAKVSVEERAALVRRAAAELESTEGLAVLMTREGGSVLSITRSELAGAAAAMMHAADFGEALFSGNKTFADSTSWVSIEPRPYGVVVCIVPWNAPVVLTMQKVAPAVVAGNTVIVKPSPNAPLAVSVLLRRFAELFPPGVINVLHGDSEVGSALISHPTVRKISFTGGPETAKSIMRSAAESLTRVHFELGGNDPAIVLDDADLDFAADKIAGYAFRRAGQVCYAVKRVYVPRRLASDFNDRLLARMGEIHVGYGLDRNAAMGPLNNEAQCRRIAAIHERLAAAGANVQFAGIKLSPDEWQDGYYFQPAAVLDADPADDIVTEEQFGPILPVVAYDTEDEVVAMANGTEYGLGSSIWSSDEDRAVAVAARVEAGMTIINGHALSPLGRKEVPFGGTKQSGIGWENSTYGLLEYVEFHSTDLHKRGS
ncbi:MAG: hypothetical protein QOH19_1219 [Actinomycetota bacterium]|jgi:acyl-CoA reductase-like NAD-dependent aldehyde dehydrogenase|nr:hypothetical protein [Actinomycetota bacterium]